VLAAAACAERHAPPDASSAPAPAARAARETAPPDAAPPDVVEPEPAPALEVLSGPAAEGVIAETTAPREAPRPDAPELAITPRGVGRFQLGLSRREVLALLVNGRRGKLRKLWTPPGEVSVETGVYWLPGGAPLLRLRIYGGRLTEVTVVARDPRAITDHDIGIGATFDDAVLAHGDARRAGRGFVLQDLPGVLFVPLEPVSPAAESPPLTAHIGNIVVVGPEAD